MLPKDSIKWVVNFESGTDCLDFSVGGVDCWPIVRNTLLSKLFPKAESDRRGTKFQSIFSIFRSLFGVLFLKRSDIFVLTDVKFSESIFGSVYLKDAHAIAENAERNGLKALIALQGSGGAGALLNKPERCVSVYGLLIVAAFFSRAPFLARFIPGLAGYVRRVCSEISASLTFDGESLGREALERQVTKNIIFCFFAYKLFLYLLDRVKPSKAYVVCYYSMFGMALSAACQKRAIPLADIQHGVSGQNMRAYSGWSSCPPQGYSTLPDLFLCWTSHDRDAIDSWARGSLKHRAEVTGSIWRNFIFSSDMFANASLEWNDFFIGLKRYRKVVLVTMQSKDLPDLVKQMLESDIFGCVFLIRAHPDWTMDEQLISNLKGRPNIFIEEASAVPIHLLMKYVDLHITEWSGAVVDAYFAGVRSIVLSKLALDYFEDYISSGSVRYIGDWAALLSELESA